MTAAELAKWMQEEHAKVAQIKERLLQCAASAPDTNEARWIEVLREAFDHYRAHLTKQMAMEEKDGYMLAVAEARPGLSREVERLAHEHGEFLHLMDQISLTLAAIRPDDKTLMRDCCFRVRNLLAFVEQHEKNEGLMIMSALSLDIGTKD